MIYLDHAATTPVRREVLEAMWPFLTERFGNPSSRHPLGETAREVLEDARARVAAVLGCRAREIVFTGGGTEADNLAVKGIALANPRGRHLVVSAVEHEAVLACCDYLRRFHGFETTVVPVDRFGVLDAEVFAEALRPDTTLCSVMLANNEIGTVQDVPRLAALAHAHGVPMHTDAVQAGGLLEVAVPALGVDAMSLSGHKLGAPKGCGALMVKSRVETEPVLHGGGQERGRRSGTENVAGAVGFALALELSQRERAERVERLCRLRDRLIDGVLRAVPGAVLTGHPTQRLPNCASFCFPGLNGETILLGLAERGVYCSSGSACAAGSEEPSHVLLAVGLPSAVARTAVRFTLGDEISVDDVEYCTRALVESCHAVQGIGTAIA